MLNLEEELKFKSLEKNCKELGVPAPPSIHINFEVKDKNGKLIFQDKQRGHSFNRNFYNQMFFYICNSVGVGSTYEAGAITYKNVNGGVVSIANYGSIYGAAINLGTDDTAFSAEDYKLGAAITDGTASGQLSHSTQTNTAAYTSGTKTWVSTNSRIFNNNSGASITVKETAISSGNTMFERSVLSPSVEVPNGAQLTVTYEISMSFAAID